MSSKPAPDIFGEVSDAVVNTLSERLFRIAQLLGVPTAPESEFEEARQALQIPVEPGLTRCAIVDAHKAYIGKKEKYPIAALLATNLRSDLHDHSRDYENLLGWTAIAAIIVTFRSAEHASKVDTACDAVRLIGSRAEHDVLTRLSGQTQTAESIRKAAELGEKTPMGSRQNDRLMRIRVLFAAYIERKRAITRTVEPRPGDGEVYYLTTAAPISDIDLPDDLEPDANTQVSTAYLHEGGDIFNPEHQLHRLEADIPAIGTDEERKIRPLQSWRRTQVLHESLRRRMALPCSYGSFTDYEVATVVRSYVSCSSNLGEHFWWREHLLLNACLMTGLTPQAFRDLPIVPANPKKVQLSKHDFAKGAKPLLGGTPGPLRLALPREISAGLKRLWKEGPQRYPSTEEVEAAFKTLMASSGRPTTIRRMISVVRDRLVRQGVDPVIAGYVSGASAQNLPGLYYATLDNSAIEAAFRSAVDGLPGANFTWPKLASHPVGSRLNVEVRRIRQFFIAAERELNELSRASREDIVHFHNRYAALVTVNLMLLTGHRPVRRPFESLNDYNPQRRWLYISDKELRTVTAGRFIPVPPLFELQLIAWTKHLRALSVRFPADENEVQRTIANALAGGKDLLFELVDCGKEAALDTASVRPRSLVQQLLQNIWPLPLNWGRHVDRRLLTMLPGDLIDAFMGHADPGAEVFACHSGVSAHDMEELRTALTEISADLGARAFAGLS
jgi:hypothetical protein